MARGAPGGFVTLALYRPSLPHSLLGVTALVFHCARYQPWSVRMVGVLDCKPLLTNEGRRSSAATAYLTNDVCRRKNLKFRLG